MAKYEMSIPKLKNPFTIDKLTNEENKSNQSQNKLTKRRRKSGRSCIDPNQSNIVESNNKFEPLIIDRLSIISHQQQKYLLNQNSGSSDKFNITNQPAPVLTSKK